MQAKSAQSLSAAEKICDSKGKRLTEPRRRVLACILQSHTPLKAYDIVELIEDIKPMSVYRALDFLASEGFVHRIESLNAYVACMESHCVHEDSQYMICKSCGRVTELHNHAIDDFIAEESSKSGFKLQHKSLELHGLCSDCA